MAEIQKIPKYSRLDQQRAPLQAEPVDVERLARMGLPRYQPPRPAARGRSRKQALVQPPLADTEQLIPRSQDKQPEQKPAGGTQPAAGGTQPPGGARSPGRSARPLPESGQPGGGPVKPASIPPQSPYEKRPPFNTSLPPRRESPPASSPVVNKPSSSPRPGSPPAGSKSTGPNRVEGNNPQNSSNPLAPGQSQRGGQPPLRTSPFACKQTVNDPQRSPGQPGGARTPPANSMPGSSQTDNSDKTRSTGHSQERPDSTPRQSFQRPGEVRRPLTGMRPPDQRLPEARPGQARPFRLPPLDFNFGETPASLQPTDQHADERPEESEESRPESRPGSRPEYRPANRPPTGRPSPQRSTRPDTGPASRHHPDPDLDTESEEAAELHLDARPAAWPGDHSDDSQALFPETPSLREVLLNSGTLPSQTAILGVANEDKLPVLLDLDDPAPGSLLVIGEERQQALDLLRVAVVSVALRNTARGAQFIVFSHQPDTWNAWVDEQGLRRYCLAVAAAESNQAREWIYRLADWADQRANEQRGGPPVLVLFDTLSFMTRLLPDARQRLDSIIRDGPEARIWSIAAVSTALAGSLGRQLDGFHTRIWGYSEDPAVYTRLAGVPGAEARSFSAPGQFAVRVGAPGEYSWLKFRLPSLEGLLP